MCVMIPYLVISIHIVGDSVTRGGKLCVCVSLFWCGVAPKTVCSRGVCE